MSREELVAWRTFDGEGGYDYRSYEMNENYDKEWAKRNPSYAHWVEGLYTAPPKREWVGLSDEEIYDYANKFLYQHGSNYGIRSFGKAIEAKLKEKNT